MNESLKMVMVLFLITVVSGGSLALVDNATRAKIEINKEMALNAGLKLLIPEADTFTKNEVTHEGEKYILYKATKENTLVGWGFLLSGPGFQDKIEVVVAANAQVSQLIGIDILDQKETPGLGAEIDKPKFENQFKGLSIEKEIGYIKNVKPQAGSNQIQAISAATISTDKLLQIINKKVAKIKKLEEIMSSSGSEK